ncbi:MAG: FtsL-like putative cell division protein [Bacteroidota bacterium]
MSKVKGNNDKSGSQGTFSFREIINGDFFAREQLMKNLWYILFVVFLTVIYIYNKYQTENVLIDIIETQKEVKELRAYSVSNANELMSLSKESEVISLVRKKKLDIEELKKPPEKIIIKVKE